MLHSRLESPPDPPLLSEASSAESGDDSQVSPTSPLSESESGEVPVSSYGPCYTPAPPLPSKLPDLNQSIPDLNQSLPDLNQSIDLKNVKDTNIDAILAFTLNAPENEPLSSLHSSQSDVEDTGGCSPIIPRMYEEVEMVAPSDPEEEEEFQTERKRSRFKTTARKHVTPQSTLTLNLNNNETPARKHVTPQSCKPQNRQNRWAQSDITEDDDDEVQD